MEVPHTLNVTLTVAPSDLKQYQNTETTGVHAKDKRGDRPSDTKLRHQTAVGLSFQMLRGNGNSVLSYVVCPHGQTSAVLPLFVSSSRQLAPTIARTLLLCEKSPSRT
ncbi:MAG: hypothetical protein ACXV45_08955, partial [Halobacteriota archaeon]